ncbi:MAG: metalloregulator ArsR/SmtB family transcription factor [Bdellovibrionota bacterium]
MAKQSAQLDKVFHALADPTRRAVLRKLGSGPFAVSDLAEPFDMSLPSFVQHLGVLEDCGLVSSKKTGRVRTFTIVPKQLSLAEKWMSDQRLDQLDGFLNTLKEKDS